MWNERIHGLLGMAVVWTIGASTATLTVAQPTFYSSQSAFNAAVKAPASFGFNSVTPQGYNNAKGLTLNGFNFVGTTGNPASPYWLGVTAPNFYFNDYNTVPGANSLQGPAVVSAFYSVTGGKLTIQMPGAGVTAFGILLFDVLTGTADGSGTDTVNLNVGGVVGKTTVPPHATGFIGFASASPVTSVVLTGTNPEEFPNLSEIYFVAYAAPPPPAPVPGSLTLISGDGQTTVAGTAFANPLVVQGLDTTGAALAGALVGFTIQGDATLSLATATTAIDGTASVTVAAGTTAGAVTVTAALVNSPSIPPVVFQNLTVALPGPQITAASFASGASNTLPGLSPCGMGLVSATNLAPAVNTPLTAMAAADGTYPLTLGPVDWITVAGFQAPILSVTSGAGAGPDLVTFQVPCEAVPGPATAVVSVQGIAAAVDGIPVAAYLPGLFQTPGADGNQYAVAWRPDGSVVGPANPAMRGETIRFLATGLGQTTPPIATNQTAIGGQLVNANVIGGVNNAGVTIVEIQYSPTQLGTYFVDLPIPVDTTPGPSQPIVLGVQIDDAGDILYSNTVYIPIQ